MSEREKRPDEKYCQECGEIIRAKAEICPKCGVRQPGVLPVQTSALDQALNAAAPKSRTTAAVLALLLGGVGAHKFYLGKPVQAAFYVLFCMTLIPALIGFLEGIRYLMMTDAEFQVRLDTDKLEHIGGQYGVTPDTHVKCPDCRALIPRDARVCQHCGCRLVPQ